MSIMNDLMYPFGNPFKDHMTRNDNTAALNNVLKLAQDKIRMSQGEMEEILLTGQGGSTADDILAERSVKMVEALIEYINDQKQKTDT